MRACIQCGGPQGQEYRFAHVEAGAKEEAAAEGGQKRRFRTERVLSVSRAAVCPFCARKARIRAVLMTVPLALGITAVFLVLSLFSLQPGRNARREMASLPLAIPIAAGCVWLCGLSVYLFRPRALYAAEIVRRRTNVAASAFLVPLDGALYRRRDGAVDAAALARKTPLRTPLAGQLAPLISQNAPDAAFEVLAGREFTQELPAR